MYQFRLSRLSLSGLTRQSLKEDPRASFAAPEDDDEGMVWASS
jgi:hypothetical protein